MKKFLTVFTALLLFGSMMTVKADTWTVAGEPAAAFGSTWAPSNTDNVMVQQTDGTYRWEKDNVSSNYATFKVVKGNAWGEEYPSSNYSINFTSGSKLAITFNPDTKEVNAYNPGIYIGVHGRMNGWTTVQATAALDKETASYTFTNLEAGDYEFGMRIGDSGNWTSNGSSFTRDNNARLIVSGSGNCTFNADITGDYTFTWTYATSTMTVTYPDLPEQSVVFEGLDAQILNGTVVNFAAIATNITNPVYSYYVKPAGGAYGSAVTSYTFNTDGNYVVKVSVVGDNTSEPIVAERNVTVYSTYTFTAGTRIYVDFSAMTEGAHGVNYPYGSATTDLNWDGEGAGTFKTIRFSENVTWSTANDFIKTEKTGWAGQKFTVPSDGQNKIIVAADGASYTWGTYTPSTVQVKFFAPRDETNKWEHVYAYSWDAAGDISGWITDEVTKDGEWYVYDVQVGANLLFHDNNGMQTNDIENIQTAACYEPTAINYLSDPKKVTVTTNSGCEIAYHIAGSAALIGSSADFDTNLPLDGENKIVFHDVEPGTYSFKINNGTWAWAIGGNDHLKSGDCASIATTVGVGDVGFQIDTKQDVTVTYYPLTQEICLGAVTVKATTTVEAADLSIKAGESKKITYTTNNTESPNVTYTVLSGSDCIGLFKGVITGIKPGTATVRVSLAETANYTAASDEFTITVSNPVAPAKAIEAIGGKFIINAKGDTAVFSRGNLKYNVASSEWYCADRQYDFVGEGGNLHFGDGDYTGEYDLFGWSCTASNFGLMQSNHDEVYTGDFVEWGGLFTGGEHEWATPSGSQFSYIVNHHQWTTLVLDPTPENADNEDEIYGLALFPIGWVMPAGFEQIHYSLHDWSDDAAFADNTIALSAWSTLEAAGAVFMPMAGARAGHWGNTWSGKAETTTKNSNPNGGQSYCFVDNIGWYGYYWSSTTDPRSEHPYDAQYLIFLGWGEGPTLADDDDVFYPPQVWSREKRRGNSVRLVNLIPRQYTVTYTAGEGEGTVPTDANKYLDGAEITLASATGLHKDGYVFAGWKFKDATYSDTYTVTNVLRNEQIVFEAQWELEWTVVRTSMEIGRYYTVCLPKEITDVRGASFWNMDKRDEGATVAYLEEAELPFPAGTPYIIQATATQLEVLYEGAATETPVANGALRGRLSTALDQAGIDAVAASEGSDIYMLKSNELRKANGQTGNTMGAYKAYIVYNGLTQVSSSPLPAPGKRVKSMPMQKDIATGIDALNASEKPVKMIIDGQLFILRGEQLYDATGRLVK